jgi:exodeoxyribonuclease V alpha subunit
MIQTSRLTEIYRQAEESMIVVNAHRINHGEYPTLNGKDTDFFFMERSSEKEMQRLITELVTRRLPAYYGVDPVGEIQVLSPTKKGLVGTVELNSVLQEACNPASPDAAEKKFGDHVFRTGDKVMQIRNNYQMEWKIPGVAQSGQGVFNGDVGFIQAIDNEYGSLTVLYDDERFVQYDFSQLDELELAYAVTVHKSQGSEFPVVIMPVSWFPPMLATRNLLYTAVTRGKRIVVLVGSENRMCAMIDNDRIRLRYSGLQDRLGRMMEFEEIDTGKEELVWDDRDV